METQKGIEMQNKSGNSCYTRNRAQWGGGALSSDCVSKLGSKEVSKICHLERSERSQSNEILRLKPQNDKIFTLAPWGEGVRRTGEGSKVKIAQLVRDDMSIQVSDNVTKRLDCHVACAPRNDSNRHAELVSASQNDTFFSRFTSHFSRKRVAFTLAEVLITLGIIGVVAALTLPSVIQNYKKQVTVNQLKKAYSTLGQVAQKAFADNGPAGFETGSKLNADDVKDFFNTYWLPYFKGAEVYPERQKPNLNNNTDYYKCANGNIGSTHIYTIYDGGRVFFSTADGMTYFINIMDWVNQKYDGNGNLISQDGVYTPNQTVQIDVNGIKPPNTLGKDVFVFVVDFDKGFVRPFKYDASKTYVDNNCKGDGTTCATKIIRDGWKINY